MTAKAVVRRRGLGMGLSALLGEPDPGSAEATSPQRVPVELLRPSPFQPRRHFAPEDLDALAGSLREHGVLQPLLVRPVDGGAVGYEIVAGERRWRAAQLAGLHEVPVVVRELGDRAALELALVENIQRADLSPLEEALAFQRLIAEFGHTQEALAGIVGTSRSHIANTLRLLGLSEPLRDLLTEGRLSAGHARALLPAAEPERLAALVLARDLNVRQTEALVKQEAEPGTARAQASSPDTQDLERRLTARLGLQVGLRSRGKGGQLTIRWRDESQLAFLLDRLG